MIGSMLSRQSSSLSLSNTGGTFSMHNYAMPTHVLVGIGSREKALTATVKGFSVCYAHCANMASPSVNTCFFFPSISCCSDQSPSFFSSLHRNILGSCSPSLLKSLSTWVL